MKSLIEALKNLSERQKAQPALVSTGSEDEAAQRKGGFKVSSKVLKFWKKVPDINKPTDILFKKVLDHINDLPREDLPAIWGVDNMADAQDVVSGKPRKAFQMWMRNVKKVSPKIHKRITSRAEDAAIIYYAFMSRVVGAMMADEIFKRYFETDGGYFVKKK